MTNENECMQAILASLSRVPQGRVCSYGRIAALSGHPGKARYVAYVLKRLPKDSRIPWHRIVNSQGRIAFPQDSDKYLEQKNLLEEEGIPQPMTPTSFRKYLWNDA